MSLVAQVDVTHSGHGQVDSAGHVTEGLQPRESHLCGPPLDERGGRYRRLRASQPRLNDIPRPTTTTVVAASTVAKTRENQRSLIPKGMVIRKQVPQMIASALATFAIRFTSAHYGVGNSGRSHAVHHGAASASVGVIREARTAG